MSGAAESHSVPLIGRMLAGRRGASAMEFALVLPFLAAGLISAADLGFALHQKMMMGHVLRSASQVATQDPGQTAVLGAAQKAAAQSFADPVASTALTLTVERYCACPGAPDALPRPACTATCANAAYTSIYYKLDAQKPFTGFLLPVIALSSSTKVRIR